METVIAQKSETFLEEKTNQTVGTTEIRQTSTFFIGCVGMDPYGQQILRNLVDENVNVGFVRKI